MVWWNTHQHWISFSHKTTDLKHTNKHFWIVVWMWMIRNPVWFSNMWSSYIYHHNHQWGSVVVCNSTALLCGVSVGRGNEEHWSFLGAFLFLSFIFCCLNFIRVQFNNTQTFQTWMESNLFVELILLPQKSNCDCNFIRMLSRSLTGP